LVVIVDPNGPFAFVLVNVVVDIIYTLIDPRVKR